MLRKDILTFLLVLAPVMTHAQCNIHLYQCHSCGMNTQGVSSPSSGNYCGIASNSSNGHNWKDQGLTPECQRQHDDSENKAKAECEKNKIRTFKGGKVEDWYCPSGKPMKSSFPDGHKEEYSFEGQITKSSVPDKGGYYVNYFTKGLIDSKGRVDNTGQQDGEWYFKSESFYLRETQSDIICTECKVVYKAGNILSIRDGKGVDILENSRKQSSQAEQRRKAQLNQEKDFISAMNKYYDSRTQTYLGDITGFQAYLKNYPDMDANNIETATQAIINKPDNDAYFSIKTVKDQYDYLKNFPNGIHQEELDKKLKEYVQDNPQKLLNAMEKNLSENKPQDCIIYSELLIRYKENVLLSFYLKTTVCYSLALWAVGRKSEAVEVAKANKNQIITYNTNKTVKYMDDYLETYKMYKKSLGIEEDTETYKKMKGVKD